MEWSGVWSRGNGVGLVSVSWENGGLVDRRRGVWVWVWVWDVGVGVLGWSVSGSVVVLGVHGVPFVPWPPSRPQRWREARREAPQKSSASSLHPASRARPDAN